MNAQHQHKSHLEHSLKIGFDDTLLNRSRSHQCHSLIRSHAYTHSLRAASDSLSITLCNSYETKWFISSSFASSIFFLLFLCLFISLPPSEYFPFHFHCIIFLFFHTLFFASFFVKKKIGVRLLQSTIFCYL